MFLSLYAYRLIICVILKQSALYRLRVSAFMIIWSIAASRPTIMTIRRARVTAVYSRFLVSSMGGPPTAGITTTGNSLP